MRQLAAVAGYPHVLAEAFDQRHQLARRARGEEVPAQTVALVERAAAGVILHHLRRIARRIERQRYEANLAVQLLAPGDRVLQRIEYAVGERAAIRIAARGVDETEQRDAAVRITGERRRAPVDAEHTALGRRHDVMQDVAARRGWHEVERRQQLDVMRERRRRGQPRGEGEPLHPPSAFACSAFEPSFMWCARPSFSLLKSTSNFCTSSLPFQAKPRMNCSLSAPPLSQLASSDEVM